MKLDIKNKLEVELSKEINSEVQVVYILSRIRKILEIEKNTEKFKVLNFYCNWALHSELSRLGSVREIFNKNEWLNFLSYKPFHKEFKIFLKEQNISTTIYNPGNEVTIFKINKFLTEIYSDTPLIIKEEKRKITISVGVNSQPDKYNSISFMEEVLK